VEAQPILDSQVDAAIDRNGAVTVLVPTADGSAHIGACLAALRRQRFRDFETIVVDDASANGTAELVRGRFPEVRVVELTTRVGFGAAVNAGAGVARGDYIAILNDDAEPSAGWLEELVACAERHPRAASIACKVLRGDEPSRIDGAGDSLTFSLKAHRRGLGERDTGQYEVEEQVFSASGTACLWRTSAFRELGGFDESFFAYYEDVDLGFRARLAGFECWYAPRAVALHEGGGTTRADWERFEALYSVRNRWSTIVKNAPSAWLLARLPEIVAGEALWLGRALVLGQGTLTLRAYGGVLRSRRRLLRQRRELQHAARASYRELRPLVHRRLPPLRTALARIDWRARTAAPVPLRR
jgi:GT2 family glycosyltransferase